MKISAGLFGTLIGVCGTALAQPPDRQFYLGADLGQAKLGRDQSGLSSGPDSEHDSPGWKVRFGYRFTEYFSVEAAYTDFGDYDGFAPLAQPNAGGIIGGAALAGDHTTAAKGIGAALVGTWPIGRVFYLTASAGLMHRDFSTVLHVGFEVPKLTDSDVASQLGLGFGFKLGEAVDIGVSWVTTRDLAGNTGFQENACDPSMLSLGLSFRL